MPGLRQTIAVSVLVAMVACSGSSGQNASSPWSAGASLTAPSDVVTVATSVPKAYALVPSLDRLSRPKPGVVLPEPREDLTTQGGTAVGVYFAVLTGPRLDPDYSAFSAGWEQLTAADAQLRENFGGRYFGGGATDCDPDVVPALAAQGVHDPIGYVVLHFPDEETANAFASGVEPSPVVVATVHTFCRD